MYAVRQVSVSVLGRPSRAPSSHRVPGSGEYRISLFNCSGCPERVSCFVMPENNESLLGTARKYEECSSSARGARPINLQNFWNTQRNPPAVGWFWLRFGLLPMCRVQNATRWMWFICLRGLSITAQVHDVHGCCCSQPKTSEYWRKQCVCVCFRRGKSTGTNIKIRSTVDFQTISRLIDVSG